jgi:hypothetical protein
LRRTTRGERLVEPPSELFYGVFFGVGLLEPGAGVLAAEAGDVIQESPAPGAGLYAVHAPTSSSSPISGRLYGRIAVIPEGV